MKLYNQKDNLIIFEKYLLDIFDTDSLSVVKQYITVKSFISNFENFLHNTEISSYKIFAKYDSFYLNRGLLYIADYSYNYSTIGIVCNQNGKFILYYYTDGRYPQLLNKFAKHYNVEKKNKIALSYTDFNNKFLFPIKIAIEDYNEEVQSEMSKNFINLSLK